MASFVNRRDEALDYDRRQARLMEEQLCAFHQGSLGIEGLISTLGALNDCLQGVSEEWKQNLRAELNSLEQVYGFACYREESAGIPVVKTLSEPENKRHIQDAVANLQGLVQKLTVNLSGPAET